MLKRQEQEAAEFKEWMEFCCLCPPYAFMAWCLGTVTNVSFCKVKLSQCLSKYYAMKTYPVLINYHAMKTYWGVEV